MSRERLVSSFLSNGVETFPQLSSPPPEILTETKQPLYFTSLPPSSEPIEHFFETPYGNPRFREDQQQVLDGLTVGIPQEVLSPNLLKIYQVYGEKIGHRVVQLPDRTIVKIDSLPNEIVTIRSMKRLTPSYLPMPFFRITDYCYVDRKNNKAWDVFQLLHPSQKDEKEEEPAKPVAVISVPPIFNAFFAPTRYLNLLMLNRLSSDHPLGRLFAKSPSISKTLEITDALIPGHEAGHKWQFREYFPIESYPKPPTRLRLKTLFLPLIEKLFPKKGARIRNELETYKTQRVEEERNAHAFALAAARRLRDLGMNILRGYQTSEIAGAVDFALSSYDKAFEKLPGRPFSQRNRVIYKREREEGKKAKERERKPWITYQPRPQPIPA